MLVVCDGYLPEWRFLYNKNFIDCAASFLGLGVFLGIVLADGSYFESYYF